jgi:hypothetical protein
MKSLIKQFYRTFKLNLKYYIPNDNPIIGQHCIRPNKTLPLVEMIDVIPIKTTSFSKLFRPDLAKYQGNYGKYKKDFRIQKYSVSPEFKLVIPLNKVFCRLTNKICVYINELDGNYYGCFIYNRISKNNNISIIGMDLFSIVQSKNKRILTIIMKDTLETTQARKLSKRFNWTLQQLAMLANKFEKVNEKKNNTYVKFLSNSNNIVKNNNTNMPTHEIIVYTEAENNSIIKITNKPIESSREGSWYRRGHWRKLSNPNKIGKNEFGIYETYGYTWVNNTICGNGNLAKSHYIIK